MKITNHANLPEPIVRAVENDPYDRGDCDITVTELIGPPQIRAFKRKHWAELEEDASDRIWALLGQAVHSVIERAADGDNLSETRVFWTSPWGFRVSGQFDDFNVKTKTLTDYKVTSVWAVKDGVKKEWEQQLNVLAHLIRENGQPVEKLQIIAILRDWSKFAAKRDGRMPQHQAMALDVPLWSPEKAEAFINARCVAHQMGGRCSDEDRWYEGDKWAVMVKGRKTALRVLDTKEAAQAMMEQYVRDNPKKEASLQFRPGENKRCEHYCPVAQFCDQFKELGGMTISVPTEKEVTLQ